MVVIDLSKLYSFKVRTIQKLSKPNIITYFGVKLKLDYNRPFNAYAYSSKRYETKILKKFISIVGNGDIVFDLGADQGIFSLVASKIVGDGIVLAVEPSDSRRKLLKENIELNQFKNIRIIPNPISNKHKPIKFYEQNCSCIKGNNSNLIYKDAVTVDYLSSLYGFPNVVKIDVEGFEKNVIEGMVKTLKNYPVLILELHPIYDVKDCVWCIKKLNNLNYDNFIYMERNELINPALFDEELVQTLYEKQMKNGMPHILIKRSWN